MGGKFKDLMELTSGREFVLRKASDRSVNRRKGRKLRVGLIEYGLYTGTAQGTIPRTGLS